MKNKLAKKIDQDVHKTFHLKKGFFRRNRANFISILRILLALSIIPIETFSKNFFVIFVLIGVTDVLDGWVARACKISSRFGTRLDGFADAVALIICLVKMIPCINLWPWIWVWSAGIGVLRLYNVIEGYRQKKALILMHTLANKSAGFIFFIMPFCYIYIEPNYIATPLCTLATLAAVQEYKIMHSREKRNRQKELDYVKGMIGIAVIVTVFVVLISALGGGQETKTIKGLQEEARQNAYEKKRGSYKAQVADEVEYYRYLVSLYCDHYEIGEYNELVLAVMMQESAGKVTDVMQSEASGFAVNAPVDTAEESIDYGVQELKRCLEIAEVKGPDDINRIKLAIQGYNFGPGYIDWATERDLGYTIGNAGIFSQLMKDKYGYEIYGDPEYAPHVLRYYVKESKAKKQEKS